MAKGDTGKILIIDDEEALRFFIEDLLIRQGWQVSSAESGEAGLDLLDQFSFDVILLDLRLIGMDGLTAMHTIKEQWPDIIIIIMTAYASVESAIDAMRHNVFDYLRKPFGSEELITCVQRALTVKRNYDLQHLANLNAAAQLAQENQPSPHSLTEIQTGTLIIDPGRRRVMRAGEKVPLTPTEFELLALLAEVPGQPVNLDRLIEMGLGYDPLDTQAQETLRVHVSRLRSKIGAQYIITVRGGGYALALIGSSSDSED